MNKELENSNVNEAQEIKLAENAFRELKPGEEYKPIMSSDINPREATPWSVIWGLVMVIIFSAATAYLGLKVGQVFEAAIPIAIIAVGISGAAKRKGALGENVIIQSIGACSGNVVAGAIFTLPALYILQAKYPDISVDFAKVFLASFLGGALGILFLIPFRKYFVKEMHGKYPFPEATATTQVLVSGQKGGGSLTLLLKSGIIGGLYDFIVATFGLWNENFTSRVCSLGETVADKAKFVFKINTGAAVLGMGYIVGLKYATIICAGSVIVWWVIVPLISLIFPELIVANGVSAASASPEQIFSYARSIGIGAIAMAGIIGIIKSRKIIVSAVSLAGREMKKKGEESKETVRTQRDLPMKLIVVGTIITLLIIFLFFWFGAMQGNIMYAIAGILLVAVIAFLFTTVAANAIAIVGSNPVSGMTLMALILSSIIMVSVGLKGTGGIVASLLMGGGKLCNRFENRLLARNNSCKAGIFQILGNARCSSNCWRSHDSVKQNLWLYGRCSCGTSGSRYGCSYRTSYEWWQCTMASLRNRLLDSHSVNRMQCFCFGFCVGNVHSFGIKLASFGRRSCQLVRKEPHER